MPAATNFSPSSASLSKLPKPKRCTSRSCLLTTISRPAARIMRPKPSWCIFIIGVTMIPVARSIDSPIALQNSSSRQSVSGSGSPIRGICLSRSLSRIYGSSSCKSLLLSQAPCISCARHSLISSLTNSDAIGSALKTAAASAMSYPFFFEIQSALLALHQRLAQPWRRRACEHGLQFAENLNDVFRLRDLHRMDILGHHARRTGAANRGHVQDRTVGNRIELQRQLVLVAVFLHVAAELHSFEQAVTLR